MAKKHIAFLRGINVGGKNKLPMSALRAAFENAGAKEVTTYIQSGNVMFAAADKSIDRMAAAVRSEISKQFGIEPPIVFRTLDELEQVVVSNPFLASGTPENALHVFFLADLPDPSDVAMLDAERSPGDQFVVKGREIFAYLPNGVSNSKLTNAYFDSKLRTISTLRNWRTVTTLAGSLRSSV